MRIVKSALVVPFLCLLSATGAMAGGTFTEHKLKGSFAYSFQGEMQLPEAIASPVAAVGVINIHWDGGQPVDGDFQVDADGVRTIMFGGVLACTNRFECDLDLDPSGTGNATCMPLNPEPIESSVLPGGCPVEAETFDFVVEDNGDGFRYVGTTPYVTALGSGRRQSVGKK